MAGWEDLVTVALLGTDRRPVPDDLASGWAEPRMDPAKDRARAVLGYAARHRAAVRAGGWLPTGPPAEPAPASDREPVTGEMADRVADALAVGSVRPVNEVLGELAEQGVGLTPEHWTAAATAAARSPRIDRALLAEALGVRGVWFVGHNPEWAQLAAALRTRRAEAGR